VISVDGSYEWDEAKDAGNQRKHGVSFAEAAKALAFPGARYFDDGSGADRSKGIGYSRTRAAC